MFAAATAATLGAVGVASADNPVGNLGTVTGNKLTGLDTDAPTWTTAAGCSPDSDGYNLYIHGPGGFNGGLVATPVTDVGFSTAAGFGVVQGQTFKDIALDNSTTIVPGKYTIKVNCVDQFAAETKGSFTRDIYFTSATAWQSNNPADPVPTTTALSVAPASPVTQGANVTLTATVSPASATGTVQFKDGAGNLGSPVTVVNGVATLSTTALAAGNRSLTAAFTGSSALVGNSTSAAVNYQVNAPVVTQTSTALAVTPSGSVQAFTPVTLSATVAPASAAGTVQFYDGANTLGNPVAVAGGSATLNTSTLAVGAHNFTARFTPANAALFAPSASVAVALDVTPFAGVSASENITTTVVAGELLISVANQNVVLPSPVMAADGSLLTTAGSLNPIKVVDTRAGNPGWNVSGQVSDFSNGAASINGANLGWTPKLVDKAAVQNITVGAQVNPANAIAPGASAPAGLGLASSRTLATASALGGNGTANLSADLALNVPTSTVAGTYSALLTLTAI
ncbi:Ig-like domain-containing protein [Actinokineospora auranticolor]|uniref:Ig-like domain-containing protein n=1 Tax=Actinokineospora auranticolor TaxID=155976 RepID=A0A2S6GUH3_9PSEU|nr:Ig-like domain-containing protein [Actinokineospora auranticolor]